MLRCRSRPLQLHFHNSPSSQTYVPQLLSFSNPDSWGDRVTGDTGAALHCQNQSLCSWAGAIQYAVSLENPATVKGPFIMLPEHTIYSGKALCPWALDYFSCPPVLSVGKSRERIWTLKLFSSNFSRKRPIMHEPSLAKVMHSKVKAHTL